jgi:hypothetical protein
VADAPLLKAPGRALRVSANGTVRIEVECPATATERCRGTIRLELGRRARESTASAAGAVVIARARFSVAPGRKRAVKLRLSRSGRRLLRKRGTLTVRAVVARRGGPNLGVKSQKVTLKRARPARRRG